MTVRHLSGRAGSNRTAMAARAHRSVVAWAAMGLLWLAVCAHALVGWATSKDDFAPAPVLGPDIFPADRLVALRVLEGLSVTVLVLCVWFLVVRP